MGRGDGGLNKPREEFEAENEGVISFLFALGAVVMAPTENEGVWSPRRFGGLAGQRMSEPVGEIGLLNM